MERSNVSQTGKQSPTLPLAGTPFAPTSQVGAPSSFGALPRTSQIAGNIARRIPPAASISAPLTEPLSTAPLSMPVSAPISAPISFEAEKPFSPTPLTRTEPLQKTTGEKLLDIGKSFGGTLEHGFERLGAGINFAVDKVGGFFQEAGETLKSGLDETLNTDMERPIAKLPPEQQRPSTIVREKIAVAKKDAHQAAEVVKGKVAEGAEVVKEKVAVGAEKVKETVAAGAEAVYNVGAVAYDKAAAGAEIAKEKVVELKEDAKKAAVHAADKVKEKLGGDVHPDSRVIVLPQDLPVPPTMKAEVEEKWQPTNPAVWQLKQEPVMLKQEPVLFNKDKGSFAGAGSFAGTESFGGKEEVGYPTGQFPAATSEFHNEKFPVHHNAMLHELPGTTTGGLPPTDTRF